MKNNKASLRLTQKSEGNQQPTFKPNIRSKSKGQSKVHTKTETDSMVSAFRMCE